MIDELARIYVAGHRGLVGSAVLRRLRAAGCQNILTAGREGLDLKDQAAVNYWFKANRPEYVFLVAGTVGGILANSTRPAEFIYDNMMIHATVVHAAHLYGVKKLLYLGSSCIYPRQCAQPIREEYLLTGPLEPTNECVRPGEDHRHQALPGVPPAVRMRLHFCDADESLRHQRQLRSRELSRPAGLMRKFHDAKAEGREDVRLGARVRPGASSCTWTISPMPASF